MSVPPRSKFPVVATLVLVLLLCAAYVLSYAPAVRFMRLTPGESMAYRPVDWIMDRVPFRDPFLAWADLCGVGDEFRFREPAWFHEVLESQKARAIQDDTGVLR